MYGYFVPSRQRAIPYQSMARIQKDIKLPLDNVILAFYNKGENYGYIPYQFVQVDSLANYAKRSHNHTWIWVEI
jgi:hypothetical protein